MKELTTYKVAQVAMYFGTGLTTGVLAHTTFSESSYNEYSMGILIMNLSSAISSWLGNNSKTFGLIIKHYKAVCIADFIVFLIANLWAASHDDLLMRWIINSALSMILGGLIHSLWEHIKEKENNGREMDTHIGFLTSTAMTAGLATAFAASALFSYKPNVNACLVLQMVTAGFDTWTIMQLIERVQKNHS